MGWQVLTHDPSNKQAEAELTKARKRVLDERGFAPAEKPRRKMVRRGGTQGVLAGFSRILKGYSRGPQRILKGFMRVVHARLPGYPMGTQQSAGFTVWRMFAHSSIGVT